MKPTNPGKGAAQRRRAGRKGAESRRKMLGQRESGLGERKQWVDALVVSLIKVAGKEPRV